MHHNNRITLVNHIECYVPCHTVTATSTKPDKYMQGVGQVLITTRPDGFITAQII